MNAMRRYRRDEYEDLDEYETDGEEEEGNEVGYEYEEVHQPTEEELSYLEYRQRRKDDIRKKKMMGQENANSGSRDKFSSVRKDNYGSFFGPSQPVIAQRVIEESKSLLENPNLAARISKPHNTNNKNPASTSAAAKPRPYKPVNVVKKKVEILKSNRNYSFLLSDDAEIPAPLRSPPPRNISNPNSESRSAPIQSRSKQVVNDRGRDVSNGRDGRKPVLASSQSRPISGVQKPTPPFNKSSIESRKQLGSHSATGPGRPNGLNGQSSNRPMAARPGTANRAGQPVSRNLTNGDRKLASSQQSIVHKPGPSHSQSIMQRPTQSRPQSSSIPKSTMVQRNMHQQTSKPKVAPRQSLPYRDDVKRPPPKVISCGVSGDQRRVVGDQRPKPKPGKRPFESDDDDDAMSMLRKMLRKPKANYDDLDDDSDMEANFDEIQMEEDRSSRIAKKEDAEQARLLELEEERRRMRLAKRRKMGR